jgi:glutathione peroxidase
MSEFKDKVLMIVNVASKCGFTPQYEGLQKLYDAYKDQGLVVLGFPCNQFGAQEQSGEAEIKDFCETNFSISFPMFAKIDVNGDNADPLFLFLQNAKKGFMDTGPIKWNFSKFLVDREGNVVGRYGSLDDPAALEDDIKKLL